ncbi:MAG: UDP-N-acetylmuramate dehydrogenase [Bacteroidota bacterium]|jgi:UDP-N-acetylmuramate dehydrogenase|nr:UDP-N-acetylmuramate dehydrogenase [Bacteroidota bacterium]
MLSLEHIRSICSGAIHISEPLAPLTSFRIGGPVDIYIEPASIDEIAALVTHLRGGETPYVVLGNGSNVLISDEGIHGVALSIERHFSTLAFEDGIVTAGGGVRLSKFVDFCVRHQLAGSEMLAGIPGTLGGAVIMNAGAYGGEISDYMIDVTVLRDGTPRTIEKTDAGFRYRGSDLRRDIVLAARFRFPEGDETVLKARRKELLLKRNAAQPVNHPNAGSIFKNPPGDFAARLIEESGLKGFAVGGARVSERHANFIINTGGATAADVLDVIRHVRRTVRERHGVSLELEIRLLGFSAEALASLD